MRPFANAPALADDDKRSRHLAWLAGLLEAEGTFLRPAPSRPREPIVACTMTDRDVIERLAGILDTTVRAHQRSDFKPQFATSLRGRRAVELMLELQPLMSARRSAAIAAAIAAYRPPQTRKLDRLAADEIRDMHAWGSSVSWLARTFGVSRPTIRQILAESIYFDAPTNRQLDLETDHFGVPELRAGNPLTLPALFWIAGWLEGEGSFLRPPPSDPRRARISGVTRDGDVAAEVGRLLGVKPLLSHPVRERRLGWSPIWRVLCRGTRAVELMKALHPLLGARRQSQIDAALSAASIA